MFKKVLLGSLLMLCCVNSSFACRVFDVVHDSKTNDVEIVDFEGICNGKNAINLPCPYYNFLINRIERRSCKTQNNGRRVDYKVYKNNKVVKTYCEGDCKSPVKKGLTPVCSSRVVLKNVSDKWKQAEKAVSDKFKSAMDPKKLRLM